MCAYNLYRNFGKNQLENVYHIVLVRKYINITAGMNASYKWNIVLNINGCVMLTMEINVIYSKS